jgi:hypothetical protein
MAFPDVMQKLNEVDLAKKYFGLHQPTKPTKCD